MTNRMRKRGRQANPRRRPESMSEKSQSAFQKEAARRYSGFTISGDGCCAVLSRCNRMLFLFQTPLEQHALLNRWRETGCGDTNCAGYLNHARTEINPPAQLPKPFISFRPLPD
jgi:hypothetical protein